MAETLDSGCNESIPKDKFQPLCVSWKDRELQRRSCIGLSSRCAKDLHW